MVMHTDLNIGNVINRLRMWTISNYMHRVSEGSISRMLDLKRAQYGSLKIYTIYYSYLCLHVYFLAIYVYC